MPVVELYPGYIRVEVEKGSTLLLAVQKAGVPFTSYCGGLGSCGKCRVVVSKGVQNLNAPTRAELRFLNQQDLEKNIRLACQARVFWDYVLIRIPEESMAVSGGRLVPAIALRDDLYPLNPVVRKVHVVLPPPTLEDNRSDLDRLTSAVIEKRIAVKELHVPLKILRELPAILRSSNWNVTVVLYGDEVIAVEPGDTSSYLYGVAVDTGTSKIIAELVDLNSGETLAQDFVENPQLVYGADVVSRAVYAQRSAENLAELQRVVVKAVDNLVNKLAEKSGVNKKYVYEVVVVGNSVMLHLLYGIPPDPIIRSPYVPVVSRIQSYRAEDLGLSINHLGYVSSLPIVGGFVGADAVADILATQMHSKSELSLLIDIGANTEVLLGNSELILAASAPSGPAFEGAHVSHGMKAVHGAIESVRIKGLDVEYETIGGVKPRGICGTGLVDTVAELYRNGIIDHQGKFMDIEHPRIVREKNTLRFILAYAKETATGEDIYVTPKDIEAVLLAKAAIRSAWTLLMRKLNVKTSDITWVYVAGSFGTRLNIDNAIEIGLLPRIDTGRVVFVGECAIVGAKMALKSTEARREVEELVKTKVKYVELSADPEFRKEYLRSLGLGV
ncbi:MAG: ASKHA domain-containing protein [Desulfurococcaceae archaeon]